MSRPSFGGVGALRGDDHEHQHKYTMRESRAIYLHAQRLGTSKAPASIDGHVPSTRDFERPKWRSKLGTRPSNL